MRAIIQGTVVVFLIILVGLLGLGVVSAILIGLGWVLMQIVPDFTLFEATVVMILTAVITMIVLSRTISFFMELGESPTPVMPQFEDDSDTIIPVTRFADTMDEYDGEAYFSHHMANAIFDSLSELPRTAGLNNEQQIRELAVRLTVPAVNILKRRRKRARKITISITAMKKELDRMGLKPYDNDILETAVITINSSLEETEELRMIVNDHEWDDLQWF